MKRILLGIALIFAVGCDGFQNKVQFSQLEDVSNGTKVDIAGKPYCEVDFADYELDTHLLAFELIDKKNVGFGFNLFTGLIRALGFKLKTEKGEMVSSMHLRETLRPSESLVDALGKGTSSKTEFNFEIDVVQLGLDLGYFRQTPLNSLTEKTIADNLKNLRTELNAIETTWSTRAIYLYPQDKQVLVPAGTVAGLRLGDRFVAYNIDYQWRGQPCASELLFERKRSSTPIATLEIVQLEKNAALLNIIEAHSDEAIEPGARIEVSHLPLRQGEKSRGLNRAVRLTSFKSEKLLGGDGTQQIDVTPYITEQTTALLNHYGLYPRK